MNIMTNGALRALGSLALAAAIWVLRPAAAEAQPIVFDACYTNTGTVYRINDPGLGTECKNANHVPFSWTDGLGAVGNGDAAGGDLGGTYPDPSVTALQGNAVSASTPSDGQVLVWNGTANEWQPAAPSSSGVPSGTIVMWSGSQVPPGWLLCDGLNGTPDLRGRFIMPGSLQQIGATGGSWFHNHVNFVSVYVDKGSEWIVPVSFQDEFVEPPYYVLAFIIKT